MVDGARRTGLFVSHRIGALAGGGESATRAALAQFRRGIGRLPGSIPELWSATFLGFPEDLMGTGGGPTRAEWAAHTALTLYALHQQDKPPREQPMHRAGRRLGMAVRDLVRGEEDEARVKRRFDAAATAGDLIELSNHLRGLIQLLKAEDIALDYAQLAEDLYRYQIPGARDGVRLNWGRDFYRFKSAQGGE